MAQDFSITVTGTGRLLGLPGDVDVQLGEFVANLTAAGHEVTLSQLTSAEPVVSAFEEPPASDPPPAPDPAP